MDQRLDLKEGRIFFFFLPLITKHEEMLSEIQQYTHQHACSEVILIWKLDRDQKREEDDATNKTFLGHVFCVCVTHR